MTKVVFCLSMPGGHMTYIGLLTKLLLGHIAPNTSFITVSGTAHGANTLFPALLRRNDDWDHWFNNSLTNYSKDDVCVIKEGWGRLKIYEWERRLNSQTSAICLLSSPVEKVDWYYSWFNAIHKLPFYTFSLLHQGNILFPKVWWMLPKKHKIKALTMGMPAFDLVEDMKLSIPHCRFPTTHILRDDFPEIVHSFLLTQGLSSQLTTEINEFHSSFTAKQQTNYELAKKLAAGERWEPRGPFDKILFDWLDTNPWAELRLS
jgi:hypothetical protein